MKSMRDILDRLGQLLGSKDLTEPQRAHYTYLQSRANERQKQYRKAKRSRRHMARASRRANRR